MYQFIIVDSRKPIKVFEKELLSLILSQAVRIFSKESVGDQLLVIKIEKTFTTSSYHETLSLFFEEHLLPVRFFISQTFFELSLLDRAAALIIPLFTNLAWNHNLIIYDEIKLTKSVILTAPPLPLRSHILKKYAHDQVMIETLKSLFKHDLNAVRTAKNLYIHRNTLLQRLSNFKDVTGYDVKKFDEALLISLLI